jgi:hypothetical protein
MARPAEVRFVGNRATTISCNDDERVNLGVIMHGRPAGWLAVIPSHEWRTIENKKKRRNAAQWTLQRHVRVVERFLE